MVRIRTTRLGPCKSEGLRLLLDRVRHARWTRDAIAKAIDVKPSTVTKILHADLRPGSRIASSIERVWGVRVGLWHEPPRRPIKLALPAPSPA